MSYGFIWNASVGSPELQGSRSEEPGKVALSCPSSIGLVAQRDAEYFYLKGLVIEKSTRVLALSSLPSPSAHRQLPPKPQPLPPAPKPPLLLWARAWAWTWKLLARGLAQPSGPSRTSNSG